LTIPALGIHFFNYYTPHPAGLAIGEGGHSDNVLYSLGKWNRYFFKSSRLGGAVRPGCFSLIESGFVRNYFKSRVKPVSKIHNIETLL
jgi:hypothetical protein